jgi:tRNA nucleotidyltransferase (CCA-adding enzyme)
MKDLQKKVIRCVQDADERFDEDALRIVRAIRYAACLNFKIEEKTWYSMASHTAKLSGVSAGRLRTEIVKLLVSPHPELWGDLYQLGITAEILPEFDRMMETEQNTPHHLYNVGVHTAKALANFKSDMAASKAELRIMRFALLLHDFGKPDAKFTDENGRDHFKGHADYSEKIAVKILRRLKSDNNTIDTVKKLVKYHDYRPECTSRAVRRAINKVGKDIFPLMIKMQRADIGAQSDYKLEGKLERLDCMDELYRGIIEREECVSLKDLAINGNDLIAMGMKPGREIGDTLSRMLDRVLEEPSCNTKEILMGMVRENS